jgi:carboxylesterase
MTRQKLVHGIRRWWLWLLILGIVLSVGVILLQPWNIATLASHPRPVQNYAEAVQRIDTLRNQESAAMNPVCRLQFMTHDHKVDRAVVLVHGYTSCPQQFHALGQRFYALGYNVLIAPLPHHGLADRMTDAHAQLTAEELAAYADEMVDIAQGLGEHVDMLGILAGGATTAWAAQYRSDLDVAVIVSPAFGFKSIPTPFTAMVGNLFTILPNSYGWWDEVHQANGKPTHAYPRYSKQALAQTLRLGFAAQAGAQRMPPAAQKIIVVTNANDPSVNNALTTNVVKTWQAHAANVSTFEFVADLRLGHDLIDPTQSDQQIDLVYPRLIDLVNQ